MLCLAASTISGFVFLTPASINIMIVDQVCRGQLGQQGPDIAWDLSSLSEILRRHHSYVSPGR